MIYDDLVQTYILQEAYRPAPPLRPCGSQAYPRPHPRRRRPQTDLDDLADTLAVLQLAGEQGVATD